MCILRFNMLACAGIFLLHYVLDPYECTSLSAFVYWICHPTLCVSLLGPISSFCALSIDFLCGFHLPALFPTYMSPVNVFADRMDS